MKGTLSGLLAAAALVLTALSFWMYRGSADNKLWLVLVIVFLITTLAFGGIFLSGRVNRNDDVHITE